MKSQVGAALRAPFARTLQPAQSWAGIGVDVEFLAPGNVDHRLWFFRIGPSDLHPRVYRNHRCLEHADGLDLPAHLKQSGTDGLGSLYFQFGRGINHPRRTWSRLNATAFWLVGWRIHTCGSDCLGITCKITCFFLPLNSSDVES